MPRYAAFLRAINVGGRRIAGAALCAPFEQMGFDAVQSFRASGNVIFDGGREPREKLAARIEQGLADSLGYEVVVFLRTAAEMLALAERQPFPADVVQRSNGKLQVALLLDKPAKRVQADVMMRATDADRLAFGVRELYWLPSGGMADSELDMKTIDRLVGPMTMRTQGTIEQVAARYFTD
jgi:uncharacterized protein (DUF1697 family)